jgi:hypothetical protein
MCLLVRKDSMTALFFLLRPGRKVLRKIAVLANQCTAVMFGSSHSNNSTTETALHFQSANVRRKVACIGCELDRAGEHAVLLFHNSTDETVSAFGKYFANTHFYKVKKMLPGSAPSNKLSQNPA